MFILVWFAAFLRDQGKKRWQDHGKWTWSTPEEHDHASCYSHTTTAWCLGLFSRENSQHSFLLEQPQLTWQGRKKGKGYAGREERQGEDLIVALAMHQAVGICGRKWLTAVRSHLWGGSGICSIKLSKDVMRGDGLLVSEAFVWISSLQDIKMRGNGTCWRRRQLKSEAWGEWKRIRRLREKGYPGACGWKNQQWLGEVLGSEERTTKCLCHRLDLVRIWFFAATVSIMPKVTICHLIQSSHESCG